MATSNRQGISTTLTDAIRTTRVVTSRWRSRTKTSVAPLVSPATSVRAPYWNDT